MVPEIRDIFQATCGPKVYESKRSCSQTIPHEFFNVFQRFREWRNKILAGKCDPLPSANSLKWADTTDEEEAKKELANAQERIAKQKKRPSEMRRETMLKRRSLTQQGVVTK